MVAASHETRRLSYAAVAEARMLDQHAKHEQRQAAAEAARREEVEARAREERERELAKVCVLLHA